MKTVAVIFLIVLVIVCGTQAKPSIIPVPLVFGPHPGVIVSVADSAAEDLSNAVVAANDAVVAANDAIVAANDAAQSAADAIVEANSQNAEVAGQIADQARLTAEAIANAHAAH